MRLSIHLVKGMQNTDNGIGPDIWWRGWAPRVAGDAGMMAFDFPEWNGISTSFRASLSQALIGTWFDKTRQFMPQQYYAGGMAAPDEIPIDADNGRLVDRVWSMIPRFRAAGVDGKLLNNIADWAKTVWPNANWDSLKQ